MGDPLQFLAALEARDYEGALVLARALDPPEARQQWRAHLLFRAGRLGAAEAAYASLATAGGGKDYSLHRAACLFHLRRYEEAARLADTGPPCPLRTRLRLHCEARVRGPAALPPEPQLRAALGANVDDRLSLAALLYARGEFGEAAGVYAQLLEEHPDLQARASCA